jgi:hypothetical protein
MLSVQKFVRNAANVTQNVKRLALGGFLNPVTPVILRR